MDKEAQQHIQAARLLVANILLTTLADNLESINRRELAERIRAECAEHWHDCPCLTIKDAALNPYSLRIYLAPVAANYKLDMLIPAGYEHQMRRHFAIFHNAVKAFWYEWLGTLPADICATMPRLVLRETAYYWEPAAKDPIDTSRWQWVGIMHHFENREGKLFRSSTH